MHFLRIFRVNVRLRKMIEYYNNSLTRWRFNDLDNQSKISKIFLRRTLTPNILRKFMVIYSRKIHFCEFLQNFSGLYALSNFKDVFFRSKKICIVFLTKKLLLFQVSVLKLLQMEKFIFSWDTLMYTHRNVRICTKKNHFYFLATNIRHFFGTNLKK